ncbi:MAG: cell wall hydrolase, partial [Proteobacteria bacterium]|nr:cell wall hydrolase [Pseudomonadota bacterium]
GRRMARRAGVRLGRWALRRPRRALGAGLAVSLAVAAVLWPTSWRPTSWRPAPRLDLSASLDCLALNIYHEARGEPREGKIAVGQVVMNRVGDPDFPAGVCAVVKQGGERPRNRCQFSWWCDGLSDRPDDAGAWEDSKDLAGKILAGGLQDPTRGALWYHADRVTPDWQTDIVRQGKIGRHIFYVRQSR